MMFRKKNIFLIGLGRLLLGLVHEKYLFLYLRIQVQHRQQVLVKYLESHRIQDLSELVLFQERL